MKIKEDMYIGYKNSKVVFSIPARKEIIKELIMPMDGFGQLVNWDFMDIENDREAQYKVLDFIGVDRYIPSDEFKGVFTTEEINRSSIYVTANIAADLDNENNKVYNKLSDREKLLVKILYFIAKCNEISMGAIEYAVNNFRDATKFYKEYEKYYDKKIGYDDALAKEYIKELEKLKSEEVILEKMTKRIRINNYLYIEKDDNDKWEFTNFKLDHHKRHFLIPYDGIGQLINWWYMDIWDSYIQDEILKCLNVKKYVPSNEFKNIFDMKDIIKAASYLLSDNSEDDIYDSYSDKVKLLCDMFFIFYTCYKDEIKLCESNKFIVENFRDIVNFCKEYEKYENKSIGYDDALANSCLKRLEALKG